MALLPAYGYQVGVCHARLAVTNTLEIPSVGKKKFKEGAAWCMAAFTNPVSQPDGRRKGSKRRRTCGCKSLIGHAIAMRYEAKIKGVSRDVPFRASCQVQIDGGAHPSYWYSA